MSSSMTPEVQWPHPSSSFAIGAGLRVDLKTLGILDTPTNPLPVGHAFRGFPVCFRYDLSVCSPPSADLTGLPQPTETFTSRLPMIGSPVSSLDMTTAATGQFLPMGLSPTRTAASFAAPDPGVPFLSTGLFRNTRFRIGLQRSKPSLLLPAVRLALLNPALDRRTMFPLPASYFCQPLPPVIGATVSEYYGLI